jgi:uncharacterized membrane protein YccC
MVSAHRKISILQGEKADLQKQLHKARLENRLILIKLEKNLDSWIDEYVETKLAEERLVMAKEAIILVEKFTFIQSENEDLQKELEQARQELKTLRKERSLDQQKIQDLTTSPKTKPTSPMSKKKREPRKLTFRMIGKIFIVTLLGYVCYSGLDSSLLL